MMNGESDPAVAPNETESRGTTVTAMLEGRLIADAQRVARISRLFRSGLVALVLVLHLSATAILSAIVFLASFPYPFMYLAMGLLLWLLLTLRFTALAGRRHGAAKRAWVTNILVNAFWIYVLTDQIPGRTVIVVSTLQRSDTITLLIPISMYVIAIIGMVVHGYVNRRPHRFLHD